MCLMRLLCRHATLVGATDSSSKDDSSYLFIMGTEEYRATLRMY